MIKYYFDLDRVTSISYKLEEKSGYEWCDEVKSQPRYFLGFQIGWTYLVLNNKKLFSIIFQLFISSCTDN